MSISLLFGLDSVLIFPLKMYGWSLLTSRLDTLPVIPGALMNTLPFRLSFPFESTERPRLKMDLHFLDFPENFLLTEKKQSVKPGATL